MCKKQWFNTFFLLVGCPITKYLTSYLISATENKNNWSLVGKILPRYFAMPQWRLPLVNWIVYSFGYYDHTFFRIKGMDPSSIAYQQQNKDTNNCLGTATCETVRNLIHFNSWLVHEWIQLITISVLCPSISQKFTFVLKTKLSIFYLFLASFGNNN